MHVTCMDHVERIRGDGEAMHASVRRECIERMQAEGKFPGRHGGGRARCGGVDEEPEYEPQSQMDMEMEVEHQMEDDVEVEEEMGGDDDDDEQQRPKRVPE